MPLNLVDIKIVPIGTVGQLCALSVGPFVRCTLGHVLITKEMDFDGTLETVIFDIMV